MKNIILVGIFAFGFLFSGFCYATGTLVVEQVTQPKNSIALEGATAIPFTKIKLCSEEGNSFIYGILVEQEGPIDNFFEGVYLLRDGMPIGMPKKDFNNNRLMLGGDEGFVLSLLDGSCSTITVTGDMSNYFSSEGGLVSLPITGIWTTSLVQGFSWVEGATHELKKKKEESPEGGKNSGALQGVFLLLLNK